MNDNGKSIVRPTADWTLARLEEYVLSRMQELCVFGKKTLQQTWLFGKALSFIRDSKKGENWLAWVDSQPFSRSTASNAIKLASRISFEDLELCEGMTVSDVKAMLGILKEVPVTKRRKPTHTETATGADRQSSREACDRKLAKTPDLSVFNGGSQDDEQTTDDPQVDQPEVSAEPQPVTPNAAPAAQPEQPAQNITPLRALEYLHRINVKLEELERDLKGVKSDDHLVKPIYESFSTIQRLRGDAATEIDAA